MERVHVSHSDVAIKSGGAPPHSRTQARNVRSSKRPRFGLRQCSAALDSLKASSKQLPEDQDPASEALALQRFVRQFHFVPKTFFITTAIYYTNSSPHVGHAYEKVLADVIARYHRLKGDQVFFLTGVDQHGQKVQQSAAKAGVPPAEFVKDTAKSTKTNKPATTQSARNNSSLTKNADLMVNSVPSGDRSSFARKKTIISS